MDHQTPHWIQDDATFFITICTEPKGLNQLCLQIVGTEILNAIRHYHEGRKWFCHLALLMPDHVHFILSFPDIPSFSPVIGEWKRWLTTSQKISWQENFFDHRIRNEDNDKWKSNYILQNPVRAGLVEKAEGWPYVWMPQGEW